MTEPRRALVLLAASFGIAWIAIAMVAAPGPSALVKLTGRDADAGLFFAVFSLAAAAGAAILGRAMDRYGRRPILALSHLLAAAGFALAGYAYARESAALFFTGDIILAFGIGAVYLTRVAAGELFGPAERARAVARVQIAAALAAVAGPLGLYFLGERAESLVWFVAPPLFLLSAILVWQWKEAPRPAPAIVLAGAVADRIPFRPFTLAFIALVCAQGAMVTIMGVTGVELGHSHGAGAKSIVMSLHFLGMFGLSLVVGRIADRAGRRLTILAGVTTIGVGGAVVAFSPGAVGLAIGLLLVGLGWSFAYIGASVVLTDVVPGPRRARVVGLVDLSTSLLSALASFAGGLWYAERGIGGLGLAAIAIVALPALAAISVRERKPGDYGLSSKS